MSQFTIIIFAHLIFRHSYHLVAAIFSCSHDCVRSFSGGPCHRSIAIRAHTGCEATGMDCSSPGDSGSFSCLWTGPKARKKRQKADDFEAKHGQELENSSFFLLQIPQITNFWKHVETQCSTKQGSKVGQAHSKQNHTTAFGQSGHVFQAVRSNKAKPGCKLGSSHSS